MQKVFLAGTVGNVRGLRDAGQNMVFNFSVAVSNGKNRDGSWKDSSFYDIGVWGNRAEALSKFLATGTKVAVSGRLQPARVHEGKAYQSVDADEVTLLGGGEQSGGRPDTTSNGSARYDEKSAIDDETIPF